MSARGIGILAYALFVCAGSLQALTVSGRVTNQSGAALSDANVRALLPFTTTVVSTATTGADGAYALTVAAGTWDFEVVPAPGSGFAAARDEGRVISADTNLDFVLVPVAVVHLHGRVLDGEGNGIPNHGVMLWSDSGGASLVTTADASGQYQFNVTPGRYHFTLEGRQAATGGAVPGYSYFWTDDAVDVAADTELDLPLPIGSVAVQVQDASGAPVSGVSLQTDMPTHGGLTIGSLAASGYGGYPQGWANPPVTDAAGRATLWLLRPATTVISAIPSDSSFGLTSVAVNVTGPQSLTIVLPNAVHLHGRVLDGEGNGVPNHGVTLWSDSGGASLVTTADASGQYQFNVTPGRYHFTLEGRQAATGGAVPGYSYFWTDDAVDVAADTELDLPLPISSVAVQVQDASGAPVSGVSLQTDMPTHGGLTIGSLAASGYGGYPQGWANPAVTDAAGRATLWLLRPATTVISAIPSDSSFGLTSVAVNVTGPQSLTIVLPNAVHLHGRVLDGEGNGVSNHHVTLWSDSGGASLMTTADASGQYQFNVTPGRYHFTLEGYHAATGGAVPGFSYFWTDDAVDVAADTEYDLPLPISSVAVQVQDASGAPVSGVSLQTDLPTHGGLTIGSLAATGYGGYPYWVPSPVTDAAGRAILWLLRPATTAVTAIPPEGGPFAAFTLPVEVTGPKQVVIALQYTHPAPLTSATFSAPADADGAYPDGVVVTLTASVAAGYSLASTSYAIDGGSPQMYVDPFAISGEGSHVLTFSSIDSSGVREVPKTLTVKIRNRDTTPPTIHNLSATPNTLWPPDHRMVTVQLSAVVTDNVDAAPLVRITKVISSDPGDGIGDGNTQPDWQITGALVLQLRAERSANGADRTYVITVTATDAAGNSSTATVNVMVPHG